MDLHLRVKNSQKYTNIKVCLFLITILKGGDFNGNDALSNAVTQFFFSHTSKAIIKMKKKKQTEHHR